MQNKDLKQVSKLPNPIDELKESILKGKTKNDIFVENLHPNYKNNSEDEDESDYSNRKSKMIKKFISQKHTKEIMDMISGNIFKVTFILLKGIY